MLYNPPPRYQSKTAYATSRDAIPGFLPSQLVQDLVRVQGQEVVRITRELDSVKEVNVQLESELHSLVGQLNQEKTRTIDLQTRVSDREARILTQETSKAHLQEESTALSLELERAEDVIQRRDEELDTAKRAEFKFYGGYASEFYRVPSESVRGHINTHPAGARISAFCQDESPRKYLRRMRMMRGSTAPRLLITSRNLVFPVPPSLACATLFLPTQRRRFQRWCPNDTWTKVQEGTRHEIITERDGKWFYLGTYVAAKEPSMVDPRAFVSMADEVRSAIYRQTLAEPDGVPLSSIAGMYGRGLLRALRIQLEYAGYNEELARELESAVSKRRCTGRERKDGKRCAKKLDADESGDN